MKWGVYPTGEPQLIVPRKLPKGTFPALPWTRFDDCPFRGLVFCRILPPEKMPLPGLPPLLPYKCQRNKQLVFPLCARCAELQQQQRCVHSAEKRAWVQAYSHLELEMAFRFGYSVLDVYEVGCLVGGLYKQNKKWTQDDITLVVLG
jgi:hypothetical protein